MNSPAKIAVMMAGVFLTLYLVQAILNTIGSALPTTVTSTFNATGMGTAWSNNVQLALVIPVALIGWYLLRVISGGDD